MLPLPLQFIIAMLAHAINARMARRIEYLLEENRVLKEALQAATGRSRVPLTNEQRRRLATKGKALKGLGGQLVRPPPAPANDNAEPLSGPGALRCRPRLGGVLNFYHREAG